MTETVTAPVIQPLPALPDWAAHAGRLHLLRAAALDIVRACDDALAVLAAERPASVQVPRYVWYDAGADGPAETSSTDNPGPLR